MSNLVKVSSKLIEDYLYNSEKIYRVENASSIRWYNEDGTEFNNIRSAYFETCRENIVYQKYQNDLFLETGQQLVREEL